MKALVAYEPPYMVGDPPDRPAADYRQAAAHTLPYDAAVMGDFELPVQMLASVGVPVVAAAGEKTTATLRRAAQATAEAIPGAEYRVAPGMSHAVKGAVLAPLLQEMLEGPSRRVDMR